MNHTFKHRNSFLRISVLLLLLTLISNTNIRNANADETTNSLKLTLRETEYKISDNTLSISPEKETAYTVEILLENVGSGDSSIVVTPYTSTALSRESAIIYSEDLTLLLDEYNFSNYALIESEALDDDDQIEILPNESVLVTVTITLPDDPAREGTVMGAINFSQIMGLETAEDSVGIKSVYESLIFINLLFSDVEEIKDVVYEDFSFVALQDTANLQFYALNYNPILGNLNNALYELINPNGETIASGELANSVLLTPLTKSRMQIPLIDDSELIAGEYRLTIETTRKAITTTFSYEKEDLDNFKKENRPTNTADVQTNNQILIWIIFVLVAALAVAVIYILKSKRKREG
ncbi:hypothetical protein [Enterococcus casseliflavus]|uniref:DUF916 domain-containing protein n=1 Tax=Enterococcus casseliflavus TaxID=37734 RepID=A0ABD6YYT2_ENTCA|nr:hypothetical protein [Enterococcus casseliflavus]MBO6386876.1 hypothetical protein [Enterococcus casseliflavus]MCD5160988.1 hypothetical protein [Enterococcus casseliflavus]MCD5191560.1 hypothetical protein [Enterococcus casseliflavus]MDT2959525.1 hypothetical protein [Enterococcus casseliflavus]QGN29315.1 hypothetical protein GFU50_07265 [Enterococcus casseliflavus]